MLQFTHALGIKKLGFQKKWFWEKKFDIAKKKSNPVHIVGNDLQRLHYTYFTI